MSKIIHTRGVYPNGDYKDNGVLQEDLDNHIEYNKTFRFGRALFVDGKCVYEGIGVSEKLLKKHTGEVRHFSHETAPYR